MPYCTYDNHLRQAIALLTVLTMGPSAIWADERAPSANHTAQRSLSPRPVLAAVAVKAQAQAAQPAPVRPAPVQMAQIDSHGRYPFGQFRGGYRYPFNYPYYRYGGSRHYPYSSGIYPFGVGPYGPYGSNYGGYSGNAYDPYVYGRALPNGPSMPDAPAAPPPADPVPPANVTPPVDRPPLPIDPQSDPAAAEVPSSSSLYGPPAPIGSQVFGGPPTYFGGNPIGMIYGGAPAFGTYPFGNYNNVWIGQNPFVGGLGAHPSPVYNDSYGPPSGPGFYPPAYVPNYSGFSGRNYGPTYPPVGGIKLGPGYYGG